MNIENTDEQKNAITGEWKIALNFCVKQPSRLIVEHSAWLGFVIDDVTIHVNRGASELWGCGRGMIPYWMCCYEGNKGRK